MTAPGRDGDDAHLLRAASDYHTRVSMRALRGRHVAVAELGDERGFPVVHFHGTPSCSAEALFLDAAAKRAGIRLFAMDRPGFGRTPPHPGRTVADSAADVSALAAHHGFRRVAVTGASGGGPYALSCAALLQDLVLRTCAISALVPPSLPGVWELMPRSQRTVFSIGRRSGLLLHALILASAPLGARRNASTAAPTLSPPRGSDAEIAQRPGASAVLALMREGGRRHGIGPMAQELTLFARPWGFRLRDILGPLELWFGTDDQQITPAMARLVRGHLRHCEVHEVAGGHLMAVDRSDDILAGIARAVG